MSAIHVYGSDSGSVILIQEHKLRVFEGTVLRKVFGPESNRVRGTAGRYRVGSCISCICHQMLIG